MRMTDRFQIVFGLFFWAVLLGIFLSFQDGGCHDHHRTNHHTVLIDWDGTPGSAIPRGSSASDLADAAHRAYSGKHFGRAVALQREAVAMRPDDAKNQYNLACFLCADGHSDEAIEVLQRCVELNGYYGGYALRDHDFDPVEHDQRFLRVAHLAAGLHATEKRQYRTAFDHFRFLVDRGHDADQPPEVLYAMAAAAAGAKQNVEALRWLENALDRDILLARKVIRDRRFDDLKDEVRFYELLSPAFLPAELAPQGVTIESEDPSGTKAAACADDEMY